MISRNVFYCILNVIRRRCCHDLFQMLLILKEFSQFSQNGLGCRLIHRRFSIYNRLNLKSNLPVLRQESIIDIGGISKQYNLFGSHLFKTDEWFFHWFSYTYILFCYRIRVHSKNRCQVWKFTCLIWLGKIDFTDLKFFSFIHTMWKSYLLKTNIRRCHFFI